MEKLFAVILLITAPSFAGPLPRLIAIHYPTTAPDGTKTQASGLLALPANPSKPLRLVSYQHGIATARFEVPSRGPSWDGIYPVTELLKKGYAVVASDYLGLGSSQGLHPFLHADSEAQSSLDLIRYVYTHQSDYSIELAPRVQSLGYSQGAHSTLALLRKADAEQASLPFRLSCVAGLSGPYDVSGMMRETLLESDERLLPAYAAYLVLSYRQYFHIDRNLERIFQSPWDSKVPELYSGRVSIAFMGFRLPRHLKQLFTQEFLDEIASGITRDLEPSPFVAAMRANDLTRLRTKTPVLLVAAQGDTNVPAQNSRTTFDALQKSGSPVEYLELGPELNHSSAQVPAVQIALQWLETCELPSATK